MDICLAGLGRAGLPVARYLAQAPKVRLLCCLRGPGHPPTDLGTLLNTRNMGIPVYSAEDMGPFLRHKAEVLIDFTGPKAILENSETFCRHRMRLVVATTGLTRQESETLRQTVLRAKGGMVLAPNISFGVNALMLLSELAGRLLPEHEVQLLELHHRHKKDSPSGTAKLMAEQLKPRLPVLSVRAGGIVGEHRTMLVGEHDMLTLTHTSFSRAAFAEGALAAARFIAGKTGIYSMRDVLGMDLAQELQAESV